VTATVMLSPVTRASSWANRCASLLLMFKLMGYTNLPILGTILPDAPGHSISGEFAADPAYGCDRPRRPSGLYGRHRRHAVDPPRRRQDGAALDAITAGQPVAVASTRAYGCSIKYKEG
jgi:hypothetical protein